MADSQIGKEDVLDRPFLSAASLPVFFVTNGNKQKLQIKLYLILSWMTFFCFSPSAPIPSSQQHINFFSEDFLFFSVCILSGSLKLGVYLLPWKLKWHNTSAAQPSTSDGRNM